MKIYNFPHQWYNYRDWLSILPFHSKLGVKNTKINKPKISKINIEPSQKNKNKNNHNHNHYSLENLEQFLVYYLIALLLSFTFTTNPFAVIIVHMLFKHTLTINLNLSLLTTFGQNYILSIETSKIQLTCPLIVMHVFYTMTLLLTILIALLWPFFLMQILSIIIPYYCTQTVLTTHSEANPQLFV